MTSRSVSRFGSPRWGRDLGPPTEASLSHQTQKGRRSTSLDRSPGLGTFTGCRKGGASAPPKSRLPSLLVPLSAQLVATSCAESGTEKLLVTPCNGGAEAPPFQTPGDKSRLVPHTDSFRPPAAAARCSGRTSKAIPIQGPFNGGRWKQQKI